MALAAAASCVCALLLPTTNQAVSTSLRLRAPQPRVQQKQQLGSPQQLDADAAALLEEAGGDVGKAQVSYIGYTLAYLQSEQPELYDALKTDPTRADAHAALVEITWDAVAAFLPVTHSPVPTPAAAKKLTAIARAACGDTNPQPRVLDVGCGNGLLLPFVSACGASASDYYGIDLSARMIEVASSSHSESGASFEDVSFDDFALRAASDSDARYDAIVFNGALQFFSDPAATIVRAAELLSNSSESRIVLSHLSGAAFVRVEAKENPNTVRSMMPTLAELQQIADSAGLQVVIPSFFGAEVAEIETGLENFFLVVLRKGGDDAEAAAQDDFSQYLP
uniref:Methyltransferase domain-containing protein n=1 Tax=Coccolithus braarudii TaxID=221442 RepID=A0A7S0Q0Z8_9EUKA|mmetsp:Transcript_21602/g.46541  ORF Transcript_21602/g.46541 Transcript_21602/m.46541 type:complete len:337 (+) Transcript_21602:6-1016(+)